MQKATEFLEKFYDLINKKQTGIGFMGGIEELAAEVQGALDDAYQAQQDLETMNNAMTMYERVAV